MNTFTLKDIIMKLNGEIRPTGDSNIDAIRLENIKRLHELILLLIMEIRFIKKEYYNSYEKSVKNITNEIDHFVVDLMDYCNDI